MGAEVTTLLTDFKVITLEIIAQSTSKAKCKKAVSLEPSHIEQKTDAPPAKKKAKKAPMKPQNILDDQLPLQSHSKQSYVLRNRRCLSLRRQKPLQNPPILKWNPFSSPSLKPLPNFLTTS